MKIIELRTKEAMLQTYALLNAFYPSLTREAYENELDVMIRCNYGQVAVMEGDECIGVCGFWLGSKLWCGKYLELDNVVIAEGQRSSGIGKRLFDYMKAMALEENCSIMTLDSYTDNFPAHKFFYREGFVPRGFHFIQFLNHDAIR